MKKYLLVITSSFFFSLAAFSQGGAQNILFTAKADPVNGVDIYAENISSTTISGILGASNLTLCMALPASITPAPTVSISSPISGQTFDVLVEDTATINGILYNIYTFNGLGSTASISFPPNTEVQLATYTFGLTPSVVSEALLVMLPAGGPSTFDYCYIAPNGTDQTNYANPFYSDIPSDPNLHNGNGPNNYETNALSYLGITGVIVPVKFTGFSVAKQDDNALLNWAVVNESSSTDHYTVQRSLDGTNFTSIADVAVKGSGSTNSYDYTDQNISLLKSSGVIYYRIEEVDQSGNVSYTQVKAVKVTSGLTIGVYPNPAKSSVSVSINLAQASNLSINLTDASGKMIQEMQLQGQKGTNLSQLNLDGLATGNYLLKVNTGSEIATLPILKQ